MKLERFLFASTHSCLDPSSGAAIATRDLLELLAERGVDCRAICGGVLDFDVSTPLASVLDGLRLPYRRTEAALSAGGAAEVLDLKLAGARVTLMPTSSSRGGEAPTPAEARAWLDLADQALQRFKPQVLLTYGGHPAGLELMRRARRRGIAVVFHLHNFAYPDRTAFVDASAVLVSSEYARRHYAKRIGLESTALHPPLRPERVVAADSDPRYVTFINPQPAKGATVFARIALELGRRRPEIPLLVVEGRGGVGSLTNYGLDLSGLENLHRMPTTPNPRDFYQVSRIVLVPSLWRESFGRVAAEAISNGLPVLASDRGALPEALGEAGFCFALPPRCGPDGRGVPTAREVAPWVAAIERLWDDPKFEAEHRKRAQAESHRWKPSKLLENYQTFFESVPF
jgi:glycosyltransferase involved in cell wall biosynthesis